MFLVLVRGRRDEAVRAEVVLAVSEIVTRSDVNVAGITWSVFFRVVLAQDVFVVRLKDRGFFAIRVVAQLTVANELCRLAIGIENAEPFVMGWSVDQGDVQCVVDVDLNSHGVPLVWCESRRGYHPLTGVDSCANEILKKMLLVPRSPSPGVPSLDLVRARAPVSPPDRAPKGCPLTCEQGHPRMRDTSPCICPVPVDRGPRSSQSCERLSPGTLRF